MIKDFDSLREHCMGCKEHTDNGHWLSLEPIEEDGMFGFLYAVENITDDQWYIGRKHFCIGGKKTHTIKGKRVKNRRHGKDSGWKSYRSSSTHVAKAINEHGYDAFNFYHIRSYETKGGLSYAEPNILMKLDCLTARRADDQRVFYNNSVPAVRFVPKEY